MDASCFFTPKSFNKTLDPIPSFRTHLSVFCQKRFSADASSVITCCSLRPESSEDREPVIESDLRSFRARLIAREQASGRAAASLAPEAEDHRILTPPNWASTL